MHKIDWKKYLNTERLRPSKRPPVDAANFDKRNDFESDFGRAIFSSALRRMHDKTQVIPLTSGDCIHTRLSHSLEVMSIAESLALNVCRNPDFRALYANEKTENGEDYATYLERVLPQIAKNAALLHDIGNPPFGHFGEQIIQNHYHREAYNDILRDPQRLDFIHFDGNAQGFRILTKLQYLDDPFGLNFTLPTLAAYLKYPNAGAPIKGKIAQKKHGVFTTEEAFLNTIADKCGMRRADGSIKRHPLAYIAEAADSICYRAMDLEDGYNMHWVSYPEIWTFMTSIFPDWDEIEGPRDHVKMVRLRIKIISHLSEIATNAFLSNLEAIDNGSFNKELLDTAPRAFTKKLGEFERKHIFSNIAIERAELTGHAVVNGLLEILYQYITHPDKAYRNRVRNIISHTATRVAQLENRLNTTYSNWENLTYIEFFHRDLDLLSPAAKLRLIVDFVSGMTDKYAVLLYQQLSGQKVM